jgi:hypothetical protein
MPWLDCLAGSDKFGIASTRHSEHDRKVRRHSARAEGADVPTVQRTDDLVPFYAVGSHAEFDFALLSMPKCSDIRVVRANRRRRTAELP